MTKATTPEPGDWIGLAIYRKVPGVDRSTSRSDAMARLLNHEVECMLAEFGPPPGWTEAEYRDWRHPRDE